MGNPTVMKYMKDFRELFGWDFTQFSCFNQSDTMLLVSSVKTTDYMDRRGYMAIMSLVNGKLQYGVALLTVNTVIYMKRGG